MRIAIVDTYYPRFLEQQSLAPGLSYAERLSRQLELCFGTFDAYSRGLANLGWTTLDIIANDFVLQRQWARENDRLAPALQGGPEWVAFEQIRAFKPDVVFLQDLSFFGFDWLARLKREYILAGQISCRLPREAILRMFDLLFTSLPHFVERLAPMCGRVKFLPLAFDPIATIRSGGDTRSREGCVFVGSIGAQWDSAVVERAAHIAGTKIYTRGERFGVDMYREFHRSVAVLNRHGFIAEGQANNLRLFEATGCGALLITEAAPNLGDYFASDECLTYATPAEAEDRIRWAIDNPDAAAAIAERGQRRTLASHTYAQRMPIVSEALKALRVEHHPV